MIGEIEIYDDGELKELTMRFEEYKHENGIPYWLASELLKILGYDDINNFKKPIEKAKEVLRLNKIPIEEDIVPFFNDKGEEDYKLSRFACYIIVINSDSKKEKVARAQVYFAEQTRKFELLVQNIEGFERLKERDQFSDSEKLLNYTISVVGVKEPKDFALFHNAGYRGLYKMDKSELAKLRNIPKGESLLDYMGAVELAAKSFQTAVINDRIKKENIREQKNLEDAHKSVGDSVRKMVKENVGVYPEELPVEKKIPVIKKEFKKIGKQSRLLSSDGLAPTDLSGLRLGQKSGKRSYKKGINHKN